MFEDENVRCCKLHTREVSVCLHTGSSMDHFFTITKFQLYSLSEELYGLCIVTRTDRAGDSVA